MRGYSLVLETPLALAATLGVEPVLLANVTHEASDWKRSIRAQGGFWQGSFSLPLTPMSMDGFNRWLGAHVTERSGGAVSWEGMVYELDLNQNGLSRRRSLDPTRNKVRVDWTDLSNVEQSTAWATNDDSIDTFGQKEEILDSDGHIDTEVEKTRDIYVARYGWPWGEPISDCPPLDNRLTVTVVGYCFTLNWRYVGTTPLAEPYTAVGGAWTVVGGLTCFTDPGIVLTAYTSDPANPLVATPPAKYTAWLVEAGTGNISWCYLGEQPGLPGDNTQIVAYKDVNLAVGDRGINGAGLAGPWSAKIRSDPALFIQDILDPATGDSEFVTAGVIDSSYVSIDRDTESPERCWDAIMRGVELGDYNDNVWQAWVGPGRRLHYNAIPLTPNVHYDRGHWIHPSGAPVNPWLMKPGMARDRAWRHGVPRTGYWITDERDFFVNEIEVDSKGTITPRLGLENETYVNRLAQEMGWDWTPNPGIPEPGGFWAIDPITGQWYWQTFGPSGKGRTLPGGLEGP